MNFNGKSKIIKFVTKCIRQCLGTKTRKRVLKLAIKSMIHKNENNEKLPHQNQKLLLCESVKRLRTKAMDWEKILTNYIRKD